MTAAEWINILQLVFAFVGPTVGGLIVYRQVMAKIAADKKAMADAEETKRIEMADAEETKRMEMAANAPERDASTSEILGKTMRNVIETLRNEIKIGNDSAAAERERYIAEIISLRKEIAARDESLGAERAQGRKEVQELRNEVADLKLIVSDQSHGIDLLTTQIEALQKEPVYRKKKTTGLLPELEDNKGVS